MKINSWKDFYYYQDKNKNLSREAEIFLLKHKNDKKAMDLLVEFNLGLIKQIARQNNNRGVEIEDLVNNGVIGLMEAINRFDINSGNKLSTYAYHYILNAVKSTVENDSRTIRVPAHQYEAQSKINKWSGVAKDENDLSSLTGLTKQQINKAKTAFAIIVPDDSNEALNQCDDYNIEDNVINKMISDEAMRVLETISPTHKMVMMMAFGFFGTPYSISEMAKELLLPKEEIIVIYNDSLTLLRHYYKG